MLRPGTVATALPNTAATGYWSKTQMLGIAVNLQSPSFTYEKAITADSLLASASELHNDRLLASVMTAICAMRNFMDYQVHFLSKVHLLIKHLSRYRNTAPKQLAINPLKGPRFQQVLD